MKTVKRKAEVGETVKSLVTGRTGKAVRGFEDGTLEVFHESASYTGNIYMSPGRYEVIIEDEPKRVHPEPTSGNRDVLDYDEPMGNTLPPHSSHYHPGSIDVIRFAEENFSEEERRGFYRMSALKYLTRYDRKGTPVDDLEKAQFYTNKLMEMEGAE